LFVASNEAATGLGFRSVYPHLSPVVFLSGSPYLFHYRHQKQHCLLIPHFGVMVQPDDAVPRKSGSGPLWRSSRLIIRLPDTNNVTWCKEEMKKITMAVAFLMSLCSVPALAAPYLSGSIGMGMPGDLIYADHTDRLGSSVAVDGTLGYNFGSTRLEAAVGYQRHDLRDFADEKMSILKGMANACYDFKAGSGITPYVMAGAGIADINFDHSSFGSESMTCFIWQAGAGIDIKISNNCSVDLGYRYSKPDRVRDHIFPTHVTGSDWESHNLMAGIRYEL
jgi:opacity protein-like surface antigen